MSSHLSRHFERARKEKGLSPSQLAALAGFDNVLNSGNRIRQFELTGSATEYVFDKITAALNIDQQTIDSLVEQDRREFFAEWLKWVNEPIEPHLVLRVIPGFYMQMDLPENVHSLDEAEVIASGIARERRQRCDLVWTRRLTLRFDETGTCVARFEAAPGRPNAPSMRFGGKSFTFKDGANFISPVSWPAPPGGLGGGTGSREQDSE